MEKPIKCYPTPDEMINELCKAFAAESHYKAWWESMCNPTPKDKMEDWVIDLLDSVLKDD